MQKTPIFALLLLVLSATAQDAKSQPELAQVKLPIVSYSQNFPEGTPPFFGVSIESSGKAEYKSTPKSSNGSDPYVLTFTASETTRARVFEIAKQLKYFEGSYDYTKSKIANTGIKTLTYKDANKEHSTSYNWSSNPLIQELTTLFQNTEETIELGHQLEDKYRFDKLGVDAVLKALEQEAKDNRLAEIQAIQPILTRIAKDASLMNISRRRAEMLLSKIPKANGPASVVGQQ